MRNTSHHVTEHNSYYLPFILVTFAPPQQIHSLPPLQLLKCRARKLQRVVCTEELGHLATGDYSSSPLCVHKQWDTSCLVGLSIEGQP